MRIVSLSDTHYLHNQIFGSTYIDAKMQLPEGDILIHAGDICNTGGVMDVIEANRFLSPLIGKYSQILLCPGNHDRLFETDWSLARSLMDSRITVLVDGSYNVDGINFYGTSYSHPFCNWAFNRTPAELKKLYARIPEGTDILISHAPPRGILDTVGVNKEHIGEKELLDRVKIVKPMIHCFGHAHSGYGQTSLIKIPEHKGIPTRFYNVSLLDDDYRMVNKVTVVDI